MKMHMPITKSKISSCLGFVGLLCLPGCSPTLTNVTPSVTQRNASNLYRFTVHSKVSENQVIANTFKPTLVIDGTSYPLKQEDFNKNFFCFDHFIDNARSEVAYYFCLEYDRNNHGKICSKVEKTPLSKMLIQDRYVVSLNMERASISSEVRILGSGFSDKDRVLVGDFNAETQLISENVLAFYVPSVMSGKSYPIWVYDNHSQKIFVGNLLVDKASLFCDVDSLELEEFDTVNVTISTNCKVPENGLDVQVMTDIPDSIIMPEVKIPGGMDSVSVDIQGSAAGKGNLYISAMGYNELVVPVNVKAAQGISDNDLFNGIDDGVKAVQPVKTEAKESN